MKPPSFAAAMAAAAVAVGASFVTVGATRLDTPTTKDLLRKRGLPTQTEIIEGARRNRICVEKVGDRTLRVTGPGGPGAARARNTVLFDAVAAAADLIDWYEIRC